MKAEILARTDLASVVRETVELRRSGASFVGLCPFHGEKTPSFHVHPGRQIFHCFGCGIGGDAFSYLMERDGLTFPEAVRELASRVGVVLEERQMSREEVEGERREREQREWLLEANEVACKYWEQLLWSPQGEPARRYLAGRGISEETLRQHRVGYALDSWDGLCRHLYEKRVPERVVRDSGLVRARDRGGFYDWFRGRVITPVFDLRGRVVAFSGRILDSESEAAKYINSPETPLFRKSASLFGLHHARTGMRKQSHAIVVEGNFDLISLHQAGFTQAVAPLGTALTPEQLRLIRRFTDRVLLCYDGDAAGEKAAMKAAPLVVEAQIDARLVQLPPGEDPDSFLQARGPEAFQEQLDLAVPLLEAFVRKLAPPRGAPVEARLRALEQVGPVLGAIRQTIARDHYMALAADALELDERRVRDYITRPVSSSPARQGGAPPRAQRWWENRDFNARQLVELLVDFPDLAARVPAAEVLTALPDSRDRRVLRVLLEISAAGGIPTAAILLDRLGVPELRRDVQAMFAATGGRWDEKSAPEALDGMVRVIRNRGATRQGGRDDQLREAARRGDDDSVRERLRARLERARQRHER